ncbi:3-hydroxypropionyl-coenzyme A dehydratase [Tolypocladium paradoxum]|uniref:3-hydroxypropionyl-coenzyme A dehydratase n=1 Tax=Tolypocladium paradoxum TaxID=94208 RepID=A0A2S4KZQ8_9HYPO|nr:3-hydroxypropionyl-coenzyme A dehydratase [Tolypocladium paradoxum]
MSSRLMKDMMYRGLATPEEAHLLESRLFHGLVVAEDSQEGRVSFLEKRQPDFKMTMDDAPEPPLPKGYKKKNAHFAEYQNVEEKHTQETIPRALLVYSKNQEPECPVVAEPQFEAPSPIR